MASLAHAEEEKALIERLGSNVQHGLTESEAEKRLKAYGSNQLDGNGRAHGIAVFLKQFINPLVLILIVALAATLYLHESVDAVVIALALLVNVVIGFLQEHRAERAFEALSASQEFSVLALRSGKKRVVESTHLVPGDVLFLETGTVVPADVRILSASDYTVSEAHLTGESEPVHKHPGTLSAGIPVYKRTNLSFMGSPVLSGRAQALVVATGAQAEVGAIAESLSGYVAAKTPIETSVARLARFLAIIVLAVVAMLFVVGTLRGVPFAETLLLSIALAVSVVPEGLPAAVTAILAIGMERILKEKGLVRNLLAAQTLGSTTVILTDKTGTLTEASMHVTALVTAYSTHSEATALDEDQRLLLEHALFASDVSVLNIEEKEVHGRPLERAVALYAFDAGVYEKVAPLLLKRSDFLSFASTRRFAAALYPNEIGDGGVVYASGAPEQLLEHATHYLSHGKEEHMTKEMRHIFEEKIHSFTEEGKRVIAVVRKEHARGALDRGHDGALLKGSVFEGFIVFSDPVRKDVPQAIREVRDAGVRVVMVTGDTASTARSIAREAGIIDASEPVVTGGDIEHMDDDTLAETLMTHRVFARILPQQKQRLVRVLTARGEVVAMTGDGVNDAPALKAATLGIAVGSGTEVAREAAGLVLLGDSFSIITAAIREGRRIMDNLKKAVTHLIATSFHEVFIISVAVLAGLPLPILPVQILWVNILEEGFLTFAFAFEPAEPGVMKRSPRSDELRTIMTRQVRTLIVTAGMITSAFSVALFLWLVSRGLPIEEIRTIMFVVLSFDALLFAVSLKNLHQPFWTVSLFSNHYLIFALGLSAFGLVATLAFEPLRTLLSLSLPNTFDILVLIGVACMNLFTIECAKKIAFAGNAKMVT